MSLGHFQDDTLILQNDHPINEDLTIINPTTSSLLNPFLSNSLAIERKQSITNPTSSPVKPRSNSINGQYHQKTPQIATRNAQDIPKKKSNDNEEYNDSNSTNYVA